jgi:hypothetical protein
VRKNGDGSDDGECVERVKEPIADAVGSWTRADLVDADSSEDRLSIAAIQSEEGPNCCYAVSIRFVLPTSRLRFGFSG